MCKAELRRGRLSFDGGGVRPRERGDAGLVRLERLHRERAERVDMPVSGGVDRHRIHAPVARRVHQRIAARHRPGDPLALLLEAGAALHRQRRVASELDAPHRVAEARDWYRLYKTAEGKGENEYGMGGRAIDGAEALRVAVGTHGLWRDWVDGKAKCDFDGEACWK